MNQDHIIAQAKKELMHEQYRCAVENEIARMKARQHARKWWHKFVPFKITITRR